MIAFFDYALHDHSYETLRETLEAAGVEVTDELMDKIGQPFYEILLECSVDTETGTVTIHHVLDSTQVTP
jgi:hypothetical protein